MIEGIFLTIWHAMAVYGACCLLKPLFSTGASISVASAIGKPDA